MFAKYILSSKEQKGETIDKYVQDLKLLSKDCNSKAITSLQIQDDCIRGAFISGLCSHTIR